MVRRKDAWKATVKNASAPNIRLPVKAKHIRTAERRNSRHCMVADAIVEHFGGKTECQYPVVDVRRGVAFTLASTGLRYRYPVLPWTAAENIAKFDQGKPVKPFRVYLTEGRTEEAGWKGTHPHATRSGKGKRRKGGKRPVPMPPKERMSGIQLY